MATLSDDEPPNTRLLVVVLVAAVYLTLNLRGILTTRLVGSVTFLATYPVAILLGFSAVATLVANRNAKLFRSTLIVYLFATGLTAWIGLRSLDSPQPVRALTLTGIQGMGLLLLLGTSTFVRDRGTLRRVNRAVYLVGASLAVIGLVLYLAFLNPWNPIERVFLNQFDNWSVIVMPANAILYRYTGFVGDPNFYPYYAGIAFVAGFVASDLRRPVNLVCLNAILLTMLLSMSRMFFAGAVGTGLILLTLFAATGSWGRLSSGSRRAVGVMVVGIAGTLAITFVAFPRTTSAWIDRRLFGALLNDRRFVETWPTLLEGIIQRPIIGHGSRSVETLLGQTAHGAVFGLFYDFGIVGLLLWLFLVTYGLKLLISASFDGNYDALPWLVGMLLTLAMCLTNSFQYDLMLYLIIGIAASPSMVGGSLDSTADVDEVKSRVSA